MIKHIDLHLKLRQWKDAIKLIKDIIKDFPNNDQLTNRMGGCCLELGRQGEAPYFLKFEFISTDELEELQALFPSLAEFKKGEAI